MNPDIEWNHLDDSSFGQLFFAAHLARTTNQRNSICVYYESHDSINERSLYSINIRRDEFRFAARVIVINYGGEKGENFLVDENNLYKWLRIEASNRKSRDTSSMRCMLA